MPAIIPGADGGWNFRPISDSDPLLSKLLDGVMWHKIFILMIALCSWPAVAAASGKPELKLLQNALGGKTLDSVNPTAIPGLYEVVMGSQILYLSEDGQFAVQGDVINLKEQDNLTEKRRGDLRAKAIQAIGENKMVVFAPAGDVKHTVNVFTDVDCGYCRKFHQEIKAYNDKGIKVRYLAYPRAGEGSASFNKAVAVWCADDRQGAMTKAKQGENVESKQCDNPVKEEFELGQMIGVRGTPSIVLENGQMVPGYIPADRLAQMLDSTGSDN